MRISAWSSDVCSSDLGDKPLNRGLIRGYRPLLEAVLHHPKATLVLAGVLLLTALVPMAKLGSEFMPAMDEGTLLYMPTALPGLSAGKASQLLQLTDRIDRKSVV